MKQLAIAAAFVAGATQSACADQPYPKPSVLVEPDFLVQSGKAQGVVVLDARAADKYRVGHLPGAVWVDHAAWAKAFGKKGVKEWSERIGGLGISNQTPVIVYDDAMFKDAARIWWILKYWGVDDVRLLNGGWREWVERKRPVSQETIAPAKTMFRPHPRAVMLATKDDLHDSLATGSLQIVDARSEAEHCGVAALTNSRAGAIPGAKLLDWTDLVDKKTHRFKPAPELQKLFADAGILLNRPTATHCQSGGRSSVMAFAMELMGARAVRNYYGSFGEWSADKSLPVVPGRSKKSK